MNNRKVGSRYEELACGHLVDEGYNIVCRNFACKIGEIDIIAREVVSDTLVFCEVKYRRTHAYGYAYEAVNPRKQETIRRVANYYLIRQYHTTSIACRFDVIGIDGDIVTHIKNAF